MNKWNKIDQQMLKDGYMSTLANHFNVEICTIDLKFFIFQEKYKSKII